MRYSGRNLEFNMNSDSEKLGPFIAISSAIIFGAIIWFVLVKFAHMEQAMASGIAIFVGGADYFLLRFVLSKSSQVKDE